MPEATKPTTTTAAGPKAEASKEAPKATSKPEPPKVPPLKAEPTVEVEKEGEPLVLLCTKVETNIGVVKVKEGEEEVEEGVDGKTVKRKQPIYHECMRNVSRAHFTVPEKDAKLMPNATLYIESVDILPFEAGKRYAVELSEMEK